MTKFSQKVRAFISEEDRPMSKKTFRMYLWLLKGAFDSRYSYSLLKMGRKRFALQSFFFSSSRFDFCFNRSVRETKEGIEPF